MQNYIPFYPGMIKQGQFYSSQGKGKIAFIDRCRPY